MEQLKKVLVGVWVLTVIGAIGFMMSGCLPSQQQVDAGVEAVEYQLSDPASEFQQGVEKGSLVTQQVSETLKLVPFVPFAKEAGVVLGLFSVALNAIQGLRGLKLKKAVTEVVSGAENFKANSPADVVQAFKDEQAKAQSVDTKIMVAEIKATK